MAFFDWESRYDLGINKMDSEHHKIVDAMNRLHQLHEAKASRQDIGRQLTALGECTHLHFKHEEEHMASISYPELKMHQLIHADLLKKFATHAADFKLTGALSRAFFSFLKMWLASHICGIDQKYARHGVAKAS